MLLLAIRFASIIIVVIYYYYLLLLKILLSLLLYVFVYVCISFAIDHKNTSTYIQVC